MPFLSGVISVNRRGISKHWGGFQSTLGIALAAVTLFQRYSLQEKIFTIVNFWGSSLDHSSSSSRWCPCIMFWCNWYISNDSNSIDILYYNINEMDSIVAFRVSRLLKVSKIIVIQTNFVIVLVTSIFVVNIYSWVISCHQ